ncbi:MAG TPA: efflux RND transporter periplasmic adaptor subunit [Planctomycetota bacterium]|nr:efflux RND transporter periplasmic adaptor subunit [Planctomycetota bacterium]
MAYLFAFLAILAGVWFGFFARSGAAASQEDSRAAAATPVVLSTVVQAPFADSLEALGTAIANESVQLTANRSDLVRAIHFDDGQEVKAGELLVELETAEEEAMLAEAQAMLDERKAAHRRAVELATQQIAPESEVETALAQLEAARAKVRSIEVAIADHAVRAPFAGRLGLRQVSIGSLVQQSMVIATLDDLSVMKIDFTIPETWLSAVRVGMPIAAQTDAWPDERFPGQVSALDTRLDPHTRSATVRAQVPNPKRLLRPGMLMKVVVDRGESASLQVPEEALMQKGDMHYVFVVGEDDTARQKDVVVGRRRVGRVEVLGGLEAGQRVVVQGLTRVRDGVQVHVVAVRGAGS